MTVPAIVPDPEFLKAAQRFHRIRWVSVGVLAAIVAAAIAFGALTLSNQDRQLRNDENRLLSTCDFYKPLTPLPITVNPATGKATELSVLIVVGARKAYMGQGCGRVPPADPSLVKWASYYHIRVP